MVSERTAILVLVYVAIFLVFLYQLSVISENHTAAQTVTLIKKELRRTDIAPERKQYLEKYLNRLKHARKLGLEMEYGFVGPMLDNPMANQLDHILRESVLGRTTVLGIQDFQEKFLMSLVYLVSIQFNNMNQALIHDDPDFQEQINLLVIIFGIYFLFSIFKMSVDKWAMRKLGQSGQTPFYKTQLDSFHEKLLADTSRYEPLLS